MECKVVRPLLGAFLELELGPEQMEAMERHLAGCDDCYGRLLELQAARDDGELLSELEDPALQSVMTTEPPPLPPDFTARVMRQVAAENAARPAPLRPWLLRHWTRRRYASAAYAMSATMLVVSAGNLLFLWTESTDRLAVWYAQGQAYWDALQAYLAPCLEWLVNLWQSLSVLL